MTIPGIRPSKETEKLVAVLVDEMNARYAEWHDYESGVVVAYRGWIAAPQDQEAQCFAKYAKALDQEELAAWSYALAVADLKHRVLT